LQLGGGYGSLEGFYVSGEIGYKNLFGLGHRIGAVGRLSFNVRDIEITYSYPWFLTLPLYADFTSYLAYYDREAFEGFVGGGSAALSWRLGRHNTYRVWTRFDRLGDLDQPPPTEDFPEVPEASSLVFGAGIRRDKRDNPFYPGTAMFAYVEAEIAGPGISWSNQFHKTTGDLRGYVSLLEGRITLASAAYAGYVNGYGRDDEAVPPSELFEPGIDGLRPIRGYDADLLLPKDENGNTRGARLALVFTLLEVGFPIYWWFRGAVFVDGGNVWLQAQDFGGLNDFEWSIGPGLRLALPVGLVRLDYGIRLDGDIDLEGRVHFGVGLPF
jgi:outer membrane protein insertion porin family